MLQTYYSEMHTKPEGCEIDATIGYSGKYRLVCPPYIELSGQGIKHYSTYTAETLTPQAQHKVGYRVYYVTDKAFDRLKIKYQIAMELLLD